MFKSVVMVCSLVCLLFAAPAWAAKALVGNFVVNELGDNLRVVVKNETSFRIDIIEDAFEDIFLLMVDGKRWVVGRDDDESEWEAVDFGALAAYMVDTDALEADAYGKAVITKAKGQKVAGIAGESFTAKYDDQTFNVIVTKNADVATLTNAIFMFLNEVDDDDIKTMIAIVAQIKDMNNKAYGLLQYNDAFVFKGLERQNYPDSYFALPPNVKILDLDDF